MSMMRAMNLHLIPAVLLLLASGVGASDMQSQRLLGGKVTIAIPATLASMPGDEGFNTFGTADENELVTVGIDRQMHLTPDMIGTELEALKYLYQHSTVTTAVVRKINGIDFAVLEASVATPEVSSMFLTAQTSYEGALLTVTYVCNHGPDPGCENRARRAIDSIRLAPVKPN
jgi:hypothetical protein